MGLFRNFSSSTLSSAATATYFTIRVADDFIVLRGSEAEAASQVLKGSVVLCLKESLKVQDVHLKLTGTCKVGWTDHKLTATGMSTTKVGTATNIYTHIFPPFASQQTLQAGNYEWPFDVVLPGHLPESVLGLPDSYITYTLKAVVERGLLNSNIQAKKLIRIVRTFDPSALELSHTMTVENIWPNKIEYSIVIPQKAIIFGTAIKVRMQFTSLLKGLKIGKVRCSLTETQEFTIPGPTRAMDKYHKTIRDIDNWTFELSEDSYQEVLNDGGADGYVLEESMPLPKKLSECMQDVDTNGLKIRHKVKFNIALHNPDGHISELRATLPVTIFISPNMPIDEDGCLVNQASSTPQTPVDIGAGAPPLYGEHVLDQIYSGIDQSGYMTPGPGTQSGINTPFYAQSRSGSFENLNSLDSVANGAVPPSALTARLQSLNGNGALSRNNSFMRRPNHNGSGGNTPHPILEESSQPPHDYFDFPHSSGGHSRADSNPMSRRPSDEEMHTNALAMPALHISSPGGHGISNPTSGTHTPEHIDYPPEDLELLNKVPSYTTALKTPVRGLSYHENWDLPNYDTAISRPSSPTRGPSTGFHTPELVGSPARHTPINSTSPTSGNRSPPTGTARPHPPQPSRPHSVLGLAGLTHLMHGHSLPTLPHFHLSTSGSEEAARNS